MTGSQGHGHPGPPRSFLPAVPPGAAAHNTGCVSIAEGDQQGPWVSPLLGWGPSTAFLPSPRNAERGQSARGLWAWGLTPPGAGRPGSAHIPGDVPSRVPLSPPPLGPVFTLPSNRAPQPLGRKVTQDHPWEPQSGHTGLPATPGRQTPALSRPPTQHPCPHKCAEASPAGPSEIGRRELLAGSPLRGPQAPTAEQVADGARGGQLGVTRVEDHTEVLGDHGRLRAVLHLRGRGLSAGSPGPTQPPGPLLPGLSSGSPGPTQPPGLSPRPSAQACLG